MECFASCNKTEDSSNPRKILIGKGKKRKKNQANKQNAIQITSLRKQVAIVNMASDLPLIDEEIALEQCGGDQEFLVEILNDLYAETSTHINVLRSGLLSLSTGIEETKRAAHSIKGTCAQLGVKQLSKSAELLEHAISNVMKNDQDQESLSTLLTQLETDFEQLELYLRQREILK